MTEKHFFSLRYKIIIAFLGIGLLLSVVLALISYRILEEKLFAELRKNVGNVTRMGAEVLDKDAIAILKKKQKDTLSAAEIDSIENSPEFLRISEQLNFMRDTEKALIRYVYLVTPGKTSNMVHYLVDADVLSSKAEGVSDDEISHFNTELDVAGFPILQQSLAEHKSLVEQEYVYDETFHVNSVSGYAPIFAKDGKTMLALLGVDMTDAEVQAALKEVLNKSILVTCLSLVASLVAAIAMGTWVTAGIVKLDNLVMSFAQKQFDVRFSLQSNDEVGRLGFSFNHMAETIQGYSSRMEQLVDAYGRFVPHDLLKLLEKKSIVDVNLGDQIQKDMTVLFSDIREFTKLSESMTPRENFNFMNSYLSRVGPEIRAHHGIIDKYIGDAVMALFAEDTAHAVDAAIAIQRKITEYNGHRRKSNYPPIKVGIGIHAGKVMLGTVGEDQRMDGTVISDTVNLASRIEGLTKIYDSKIILSEAALQQVKARENYRIRFLDRVKVSGKSTSVDIYELFDTDADNMRELKQRTLADFNNALEAYYAKRFKEAADLFKRILSIHAEDTLARIYHERAIAYAQSADYSHFDGITHYDSK